MVPRHASNQKTDTMSTGCVGLAVPSRPSYPASLPHMSELPAVLPGKRAGYPPACLGEFSMKHRRGGGSACIRPAANAAELMRANRRTNLFGGCPVAAHPVRGVPSAGRKRRQPTKLLEQLPHHLRPKSTGRRLCLVLQSLLPGIWTTAPGRDLPWPVPLDGVLENLTVARHA
jgi:hypothetical protein